MVAYLEKTDGNTDFHEIIDFLTRSSIYYALTVSPVVSTTFVEQFWMSAKSKIINNVRYITAKVAGKPVTISEASIRSDLLFDDADGIDSMHNQAIFDAIQLMGYEGDLTVLTFNKALFSPQWRFLFHTMNHCISSKSTSWDQIPTNIATALSQKTENVSIESNAPTTIFRVDQRPIAVFLTKAQKLLEGKKTSQMLSQRELNEAKRKFDQLARMKKVNSQKGARGLEYSEITQEDEITPEGIELILWGDLKIMMESSTEENDQGIVANVVGMGGLMVGVWSCWIGVGGVALHLVALDNALVAPMDRVKIGKCNMRINPTKKQKEATYQVIMDTLSLSPCYNAFTITVDVSEIYMQQFWFTISKIKDTSSYHFKLDKKKFIIGVEVFHDVLQICPRLLNQEFVEPPSHDEMVTFIKSLGYKGALESVPGHR
ncbi:hypothetical protein Tco_0375409 [Tanacetum coccineum]